MGISAGQTAEIGAVTGANAGDEETHFILLRFTLVKLAAAASSAAEEKIRALFID